MLNFAVCSLPFGLIHNHIVDELILLFQLVTLHVYLLVQSLHLLFQGLHLVDLVLKLDLVMGL